MLTKHKYDSKVKDDVAWTTHSKNVIPKIHRKNNNTYQKTVSLNQMIMSYSDVL